MPSPMIVRTKHAASATTRKGNSTTAARWLTDTSASCIPRLGIFRPVVKIASPRMSAKSTTSREKRTCMTFPF